ncbi:uncharacterized protein LOC127262140 [Andrographis paniculata]|uniref:uncharacterized protein LOC127262140 n=1 Tax=Andrographis paniculata TaxID=175694 RepID=UPI0021E86FC4|nr:uncharacterized protein LOC127262140 [Andrographis paniculata]
MAAAAALSKYCLQRAQRCYLHRSWNWGVEYSPRYSYASLGNFGNQFRRFSRSTDTNLRKVKELKLSDYGREYCRFPSRTSPWPSPQKLKLIGWYLSMLESRPIATKSFTSALIYTAADVSSQTIVGERYDYARTLRMAGYGMLILGPSLHYWYNFMSRVFPNRDLLSTLKKMASGQLLYGPAMTTVFFSMNAALQGESNSEITARLKRDLLPTIINGAMYWPVCDFVTFRFVPVHLQPLVANSFSYLWTVYMTYMASLGKPVAS